MGRIEKFKDQSYGSLRRKYLGSKDLFEDPLFPPNDYSLSLSKPLHGSVVWKRPLELCSAPKLFVDKASSKDVTQGSLGNCWFVAACASLATVKPLWSQVVPDYKLQEWDPVRPEQYAGIFHFRFWRFGKWIDVVVDDRLPTIGGQLVFCHSETANEFWSALLEKAYAKLCGSYGAMDGGNLCDALVDFTSGLAEMILLKEGYRDEPKKNQLRKSMLREYDEHALMCCAISVSDSALFETRTATGLVLGHAYGITAVKEINVGGSSGLMSLFRSGEKITLVRLRNPWGSKEWNGAFSDRSAEWTKISKSEKDKLGLTVDDDGEFWMPYDDFISEFSDLSICRLINTSVFNFRKTWYENYFEGQWTEPLTAGGCPNNDTFLKNPQFCFDVPSSEMELVVQLLQTDLRGKYETVSRNHKTEYKSIGFHVMQVEQNRKYRLHKNKKKAFTSDYVRSRSVFYRGSLSKGRYVLVPTTFEPSVETEFFLRVYTGNKIHMMELTKDFPQPGWCCSLCCASPTCVSVVTVDGATGLSKLTNTYCIIKTEKESLKSQVIANTSDPTWNLSGVFFRYDICKPFTVEVWEDRIFRDKFLGCAVISGSADNQTLSIKSPLVGRGNNEQERHPGELRLTVTTYDDVDAA
ncbi:unnamed protein product [Allacma fusca]|uniref:Calpain-5 n=1 Tax=Allacma fusca TaxID=39272 RepID=A0A8J2MHH2_9HEXA|nr:unnamed protein product [Allacma fusca]